MKATGVTRRIDELGRVVLPIEIRKALGLTNRDTVEIYVEQDAIVLRKYEPSCIFCGSIGDARLVKGKMVCDECLDELRKEL